MEKISWPVIGPLTFVEASHWSTLNYPYTRMSDLLC